VKRSLGSKRSFVVDELGDIRPVDQSHNDVQAAFRLARIQDFNDVWMLDRRGEPPLALESVAECLVLSKLRRQQLERPHSAELLVASTIDHTHPALSEKGLDSMADQHAADE